jgi:hypothetical protein
MHSDAFNRALEEAAVLIGAHSRKEPPSDGARAAALKEIAAVLMVPTKGPYFAIVAHALSGKSTAVKASDGSLLDVDDLRTPALESKLKELRSERRWDAHNRIWRDHLMKADAHGYEGVLVHSYEDAVRGFGIVPSAFVIIPADVMAERVATVSKTDPSRAALAMENRDLATQEASLYPSVPVVSTVEAALEVARRRKTTRAETK